MMPEYAARLASGSGSHASGVPDVLPDGASGMPVADSGSAPSPNPSPSPSPNPSPSPKREPRARCASPLPDWLPAEAWADWHAYRMKAKPKGWTPKAQQLSISALANLHADGHAPRAVIEQSIERGWAGLFPLKSKDDRSNDRIEHPRPLSVVERVRANAVAAEQRDAAAAAGYLPAHALAADG